MERVIDAIIASDDLVRMATPASSLPDLNSPLSRYVVISLVVDLALENLHTRLTHSSTSAPAEETLPIASPRYPSVCGANYEAVPFAELYVIVLDYDGIDGPRGTGQEPTEDTYPVEAE